MATEQGWAIVGNSGLYTGWWLRRTDAIGSHVEAYHGAICHHHGAALTDEQKRLWRGFQERGDRAVKITIKYRS